jgi:hypothetical protein
MTGPKYLFKRVTICAAEIRVNIQADVPRNEDIKT